VVGSPRTYPSGRRQARTQVSIDKPQLFLVHVTEPCEPEEVHLLPHVETRTAAVHEAQRTEAIEEALVAKDVAPGQHLVMDTASAQGHRYGVAETSAYQPSMPGVCVLVVGILIVEARRHARYS
jgi:hypothetical protein